MDQNDPKGTSSVKLNFFCHIKHQPETKSFTEIEEALSEKCKVFRSHEERLDYTFVSRHIFLVIAKPKLRRGKKYAFLYLSSK